MVVFESLAVIGVMGSSRFSHRERSRRVGRWIAQSGYHLLTGGGGGVMAAVSEAFVRTSPRKGRAIGVLPSSIQHVGAPPLGYPNRWVEITIRTHLNKRGSEGERSDSRNHVNVLSSDVIIVLPGAEGTASEAQLALHYGRPCVAYLDNRRQVPDLPLSVPAESEFEQVKQFVVGACTK
jgi:uncharacterized protein (TIGR00725 family)